MTQKINAKVGYKITGSDLTYLAQEGWNPMVHLLKNKYDRTLFIDMSRSPTCRPSCHRAGLRAVYKEPLPRPTFTESFPRTCFHQVLNLGLEERLEPLVLLKDMVSKIPVKVATDLARGLRFQLHFMSSPHEQISTGSLPQPEECFSAEFARWYIYEGFDQNPSEGGKDTRMEILSTTIVLERISTPGSFHPSIRIWYHIL